MPEYSAGQLLICTVAAEEPGGYNVTLPKDHREAFLPSQFELQIGEKLEVLFVCEQRTRLLLSLGPNELKKERKRLEVEKSPFESWATPASSNAPLSKQLDDILKNLETVANELAGSNSLKKPLATLIKQVKQAIKSHQSENEKNRRQPEDGQLEVDLQRQIDRVEPIKPKHTRDPHRVDW